MTYFGFLLAFLVTPIALLLAAHAWSRGRQQQSPFELGPRAVWTAIGIHVALAVLYTTPWDNYLVATRVWYYHPQRVTGILLGYVPIEEYAFFVLEAVLTGLWWWWLARRIARPQPVQAIPALRVGSVLLLGALWIASVVMLARHWIPGTYLCLILAWALPPVAIQLAVGADILWHFRRLLAAALLPLAAYLALADSLAIHLGIWTIDPPQITGLRIGPLPLEEGLFFVMTLTLLSFGMTLALAHETRSRLGLIRRRLTGAQQSDAAR
jgi:lycopene cyclase domain-containing protein